MRKYLLSLCVFALVVASSAHAEDCCFRREPRSLGGRNCYYLPQTNSPFAAATAMTTTGVVLDASGKKAAQNGYLWLNGAPTSTKACTSAGCKLWFKTGGTLTWASAGSTIIVSLQDPDTTAVIGKPDESADVSKSLVQGTDALSASTWTQVAFDTNSKTLTHGMPISAVFDMSVRNGSDSVQVSSPSLASGPNFPNVSLKSGTWSNVNAMPNVLIQTDDGTYGWIDGGWPYFNVANHSPSYASDSTPNEKGTGFFLPEPMEVDAFWFTGGMSTVNSAADLVLYQDPYGTPVSLASKSITGAFHRNGVGPFVLPFAASDRRIIPSGYYSVTYKPTTAGANAVYFVAQQFSSSAIKDLIAGADVGLVSRTTSGAFSVDNTYLPQMGVRVCRVQAGY